MPMLQHFFRPLRLLRGSRVPAREESKMRVKKAVKVIGRLSTFGVDSRPLSDCIRKSASLLHLLLELRFCVLLVFC
jgi:hypothetical protein